MQIKGMVDVIVVGIKEKRKTIHMNRSQIYKQEC